MPWYESFFHGLPQDAWRQAQSDDQTQLELELLVESLELGPGDQLLDIFCGYGRHALPLARMGCTVTGVDIAADYIADLQQNARVDDLAVTAIEGDFLQVPLRGPFDAAYCLGNSFSFFPYPVMRQFLARIAMLLPSGGRFLAHSGMVAEAVLPDFQERTWMPAGDPNGSNPILFLADNRYDPAHSCIHQHLTYVHHGQTETRQAIVYVYTVAELSRLFVEAGFAPPLSLFGDTDGRAFELGDESVWFLTHKI